MALIRQWVLLLIGMAFLNASAMGAHLHLCLDGQEPPVSLHVLDAQGIHHDDASEGHNDIDLSLTEDRALAKVFKFDLSACALPSAWTVPTITVVESLSGLSPEAPDPPSLCRFLLPPLRGPPA